MADASSENISMKLLRVRKLLDAPHGKKKGGETDTISISGIFAMEDNYVPTASPVSRYHQNMNRFLFRYVNAFSSFLISSTVLSSAFNNTYGSRNRLSPAQIHLNTTQL